MFIAIHNFNIYTVRLQTNNNNIIGYKLTPACTFLDKLSYYYYCPTPHN